MSGFAELLGRTNFSFLEGASHPDEMVGRAQELGYAALGVADRDGFYGIVKAHVAAKAAALPLVLGARMTVEGIGTPVALLARDGAGYSALCALITAGRMRNGKGVCTVSLDEIAACATGCFAVATSFLQFFPRTPPFATGTTPPPVVRPPRRGADLLREEVATLREIFGDSLSIAVARHFSAGDEARFFRATTAANALGVPLLATNDPYVHAPERSALHDVVTAIRERTTVAALGTRRLPSAEWHL